MFDGYTAKEDIVIEGSRKRSVQSEGFSIFSVCIHHYAREADSKEELDPNIQVGFHK